MTYRLAAGQVVTAIEGIALSSLDSRLGMKAFKHDPKIGGDYVGNDRSFNLQTTGGSMDARRHGNMVADVEVLVDYRERANRWELEKVISADVSALVNQLKDTNNWGRPASTICVIYPTGEEMFPYSIDEVEDEDGGLAYRLSISIAIEHQALTAN